MNHRLPLVLLLTAVAAATAQRQVTPPPDHTGQPLGPLQAEFISNDPGKLENRPLLIEFWATWCPPCRKTIPQLNQLHAKYKDQGLVVIGLSDEPAETLQKFIQAQPTHYAIASDPQRRLSQRLGITFIPYCILVDASGKIAWQGSPHLIPDGLIPKVLADAAAQTTSPKPASPNGETPPPSFRPGPRPNWY